MAEKPSAPLSGDLLAPKGLATAAGFALTEAERVAARWRSRDRWRVAALAATIAVSVGVIAFVGAALIYGGSLRPGTGQAALPANPGAAEPGKLAASAPESLFDTETAEVAPASSNSESSVGTGMSDMLDSDDGERERRVAERPTGVVAEAPSSRAAAAAPSVSAAVAPPPPPPKAPSPEPENATAEPASPATKLPKPKRRPRLARAAYRVQLHALASDAAVRREWRRLRKKHADLLAGLELTVAPKRSGGNGKTLYRMQIGALPSRTHASSLCRKLRREKLSCMVVR